MCCDKAVGIAGLLALLLLCAEPTRAMELTLVGEPQTMVEGGRGACGGGFIPDAGARAFRTADGGIRMIAAHHVNRVLEGPSLEALTANCKVVYRGAYSHEPQDYDDHAWIAGIYSPDGRTVHALVHDELHGHRRPDLCPAARYMACWANRITGAVSTDGGLSFTRTGLIAAPPYRYDGTLGRHVGYFSPANIIEKDGWYYATIFATTWGAQKHGVCLMRTRELGDPASWRAWDGRGFTVRFIDAYRSDALPENHVCTPVGALGAPVTGLVRHRPTGTYIATLSAAGGVYLSTSPDLIAWSPPKLVWAVPVIGQQGCDEPWAIGYPALIDETAPERNFESVGDEAWLYYTRMWTEACKLTMRRDLVRVRVRLTP